MKELKEIHEIMEKIYNEEKNLSREERIKRAKKEAEEFLLKRKLNLKRVGGKELKQIAI